jgi:hypothetical protein
MERYTRRIQPIGDGLSILIPDPGIATSARAYTSSPVKLKISRETETDFRT